LQFVAAAALELSLTCALPAATATARSTGCAAHGYSYAGVQEVRTAHGIRATLTAMTQPRIEDGLVAAWVGVGGPGEGTGHKNAWIQAGLVTNELNVNHLYLEVNRPRSPIRYTELVPDVPVGLRYHIGVVEIASQPGWWQVWLNGSPASAAFRLPGSSGRWRPIATVEEWVNGDSSCNDFAYRFEHVAVEAASAHDWRHLIVGDRFEAPGFRMLRATTSTFLVTSS
jgi:hypothetical protein